MPEPVKILSSRSQKEVEGTNDWNAELKSEKRQPDYPVSVRSSSIGAEVPIPYFDPLSKHYLHVFLFQSNNGYEIWRISFSLNTE